MTDKPITLDRHRGMAAQKATEIRRLMAEVEANEKSLRDRQEELETQLVAAPAATWLEAAEKARYLLGPLCVDIDRAGPAQENADRQRAGGLRPPLCGQGWGLNQIGPASVTSNLEGRFDVAKKQQRSNREKRKPKANKPKASAQVLPFGGAQGFGGLKSSAGKKAR